MKYAEINKKYTQIVAEYFKKGYQVNSGTMSGTQGEIAKIDFTDGKKIIRVMLNSFYYSNFDGYEIIVSKCIENIKINGESGIGYVIWNDKLEVVYREKFYKIGEDSKAGTEYGTEEQAKETRQKHCERYKNKVNDYVDLTDKYIELGKEVVKRVYNKRKLNDNEIKVYKNNRGYFVSYKYNTYRLH